MNRGALKPRTADYAAFVTRYLELRRHGLAGPEVRKTMTAEWGHAVSRPTMFRWWRKAEEAETAEGILPGAGQPAVQGEPIPPPTAKPRRPRRPRKATAEGEQPATGTPIVRVAHLPLTEMLGEIIQVCHGTMRYAVGDNTTKPRNPALALRASASLIQAIQASLDIHAKFHDASRMEAFTSAIMSELEQADSKLAQRVMARLDAIAQGA